ncbi:oligopeptidase A [Vibrio ponticus]|nr:oligopeptidase A [Vibrio ponticus]
MSNPLLTFTDLPPFSQIKPEHIKPAVEQAISDCRDKIEQVMANASEQLGSLLLRQLKRWMIA